MKQSVFFLSISLFLFGWGSTSHASICITSFKQAAVKAAADPECRSAAQELLKSYTEQVRICKEHRQALKVCREAKQDEKKSCQRNKKAAKKDCRKLKGKAERDCKKEAREAKQDCTRDARKQKQACKDEAKRSEAFAVCKDARRLTGKAAGKFGKCAAKHFLPAAIKCAAALAVGAG